MTMQPSATYDLIIIGTGPAGFAAATRAAQMGKKVLCIEKEAVGGTCLHWGCMPTKALLKSTSLYESLQKCSTYGLQASGVSLKYPEVVSRSRRIVETLHKGLQVRFQRNKIDTLSGTARLSDSGLVEITEGPAAGQRIAYKNVLLATGCKPRLLPGMKIDGKRVLTSREAMQLKELPRSAIILGAGAIGVEFAYLWSTLGCKVTLVEAMPQLLPQEDADVAEALTRSLQARGVTLLANTKAEDITVGDSSVRMHCVNGNMRSPAEAEVLLVAIGLSPTTEGLSNHLTFGSGGYIAVDEYYQTSMPRVYAAGDVIGAPLLAHVAMAEGMQVVNGLFAGQKPKRIQQFPSCLYCQPQVACVGMREKEIQKQGIAYKVSKMPFSACGMGITVGHTEGFIKLIVQETDKKVLGVQIVGADATEMIAEHGLAIQLGATAQDLMETVHAHPTFSETVPEVAMQLFL